MARYYFHVRRGQVTIIDHRGVDLADLEEAAKEAAQRALQIERREVLTDVPRINGAIVVEDEFRTSLRCYLMARARTVMKAQLGSPYHEGIRADPSPKMWDIEVSLAGDVLTIKGEKKTETEEKKAGSYYTERRYGSFARSLRR
jgi:Hsp20/alpha crystallin family